jgi:hypothetical protein
MTETMTQFSISLGNKPGLLGTICRRLASAKINILALSLMDATNHGVLRLVAEKSDRVRAALKELDLPTVETKVLAVSMPNRPGAMADFCEKLSANRVRVSYLYQTTGALGGKSMGIFKVQNINKAAKVLESKRVTRRDMKMKLRNSQRATVGMR